jgi:hypothetical protein
MMVWARMYIKSNIQRKKEMFIATIRWSWYAVQYFDELEIFDSLDLAKNWILEQRTNGSLTYSNVVK